MSGTSEFMAHAFSLINAAIALCYGLLAVYFATRLKLPSGPGRSYLPVLAWGSLGLFFIGCAHTHLDLAIWSATDNLMDHWFSWWNVLSHLLQAIGGLVFWVLATFYLQINIFDKRHYEKTVGSAGSSTGSPPTVDKPVDNS